MRRLTSAFPDFFVLKLVNALSSENSFLNLIFILSTPSAREINGEEVHSEASCFKSAFVALRGPAALREEPGPEEGWTPRGESSSEMMT